MSFKIREEYERETVDVDTEYSYWEAQGEKLDSSRRKQRKTSKFKPDRRGND